MNVFIFTKVKESRQGERDKTVNGKIGCEERLGAKSFPKYSLE